MANPAQLARQRAQSIWPGATVHGRGQKWIGHQHPSDPNRYMLDASVSAIHYGVGQDQEIDTAWQPSSGNWQWEMTHADYQSYARDIFNVGDVFEFRSGGEWVRFDPQSINWIDETTSRQQIAIKGAVVGQVNDSELAFPAAYGTGRHFTYYAGTTRLTKLITIDSLSHLPAPTLGGSSIWFEAEFSLSHSSGVAVYLDGALWAKNNGVRVQTADRIEFRDAATGSDVLWWLDYPTATDSGANRTVGQMEVRRQGGPSALFICVRIPKPWIDSAAFPIFIDPSIDKDVAASGDDGYARSNFGDISAGANIMYVGLSAGEGTQDNWNRFTGISGLSAATITVSYIEQYVAADGNANCYSDFFAEDAESPTAPTDYASYHAKTRTSASVPQDGAYGGTGYQQSPSLNTIIQELATDYDPSAIQIFQEDGGTASGNWWTYSTWDFAPQGDRAAKLHIEYMTDLAIAITPTNPSYWKQGVRIVG